MFFNIDADDGHAVRGWIVLDNPAAIPSVTAVVPGREGVEVQAFIHRSDVQELGVHATGLVGFEINDSQVPGMAELDDLAIFETESRLLIFRRASDRHIEKKLYLFDHGVLPQDRLAQAVLKQFTLSYINTERFSLETMLVIINNHFAKSLFLLGRSNFNRYASFLNNAGFLRAALLREPFEDLAERLMFLKIVAKLSPSAPRPPTISGLDPLIDFARNLPLGDPRGILQAFRGLDPEQRQILSNPMVKLYGCNFDEFPRRQHVGVALENLASMDVVGSKARFDDFRALLAGRLERNVLNDAIPLQIGAVSELGVTLSKIGLVADLLEYDLELYSFADSAIQSGFDNKDSEPERDTHSI
jgi:hypothetical protein